MFKTVYTARDATRQPSNAGLPERPNYKPHYLDGGSYELVEDGVIHSLDDIQAWLPTCDMGVIMRQYIRTGDESILQRRAGFYADVTDMPKDYIALRNMLNDADNIFASLPLELREKFGHSPSQFYANPELADAVLNQYISDQKAKQVKVVPEVSDPPLPTPTPVIPESEVK